MWPMTLWQYKPVEDNKEMLGAVQTEQIYHILCDLNKGLGKHQYIYEKNMLQFHKYKSLIGSYGRFYNLKLLSLWVILLIHSSLNTVK